MTAQVAAKVFQAEGQSHAERQALAEHEYSVVGHLTHDNIIRVHGLLVTGGLVCMLQELALGGDLFAAIDFGYGVDSDKACSYLRDVTSALRYIHDPCVGLVHLDIKSENVLVLRTGAAKLCDFDTAARVGTEVQEIRGTPQFIPPEAVNKNPVCVAMPTLCDRTFCFV
jgi:serine/threonine protein kinase